MCNGKPTIIDFYADWCVSCREMAPSMRSVEMQYRDKINFVTIDGSDPKNGEKIILIFDYDKRDRYVAVFSAVL
jgi:thiol-disulfide isomerase/thioredoxin